MSEHRALTLQARADAAEALDAHHRGLPGFCPPAYAPRTSRATCGHGLLWGPPRACQHCRGLWPSRTETVTALASALSASPTVGARIAGALSTQP